MLSHRADRLRRHDNRAHPEHPDDAASSLARCQGLKALIEYKHEHSQTTYYLIEVDEGLCLGVRHQQIETVRGAFTNTNFHERQANRS